MVFSPIPGTLVIGIGHKARQGKDTIATTMLRDIPAGRRFGFADDLYAIARVRHGMTTKDPALLQRLGLEYRDEFGADIWIRSVYTQMREHPAPLAVLTDVRFPNELDFIHALGGVTVRVQRVHSDGSPFRDPSRDPHHVSETLLDTATWDHDLLNHDGHLDRLRVDARTLLFSLWPPRRSA